MARTCEICKTPEEIAARLDLGLRNPGKKGCVTARRNRGLVYNVEREGALICRINEARYNPGEITVIDKDGSTARLRREQP